MYFFCICQKLLLIFREIKENNIKYDLIIYEALHHSALLGFAELVGNPPVIGILTMQMPSPIDSEYGNPIIPSYIPSMGLPFSDKMTLLERLENFFMAVYYDLIINFYNKPIQERLLKENFGVLKYTAEEMEHNKSLLLVACDLATGYPKPVNPNVIYTGALHISTPGKLPEVS